MVGAMDFIKLLRCNSNSNSRRSRRKMLKTRTDFLDSLPEDLLIQILIRIPVQDILDSTMFVSRKWFRIIKTRNFIFSHLHHHSSSWLLLIKPKQKSEKNSFLSMTQAGQIEISAFTYNPKCQFWSSCNGLLLEPNFTRDTCELMITNPVTKRHLELPPFTLSRIQFPDFLSALAFVRARMEHKVVRTYFIGAPDCKSRVHCGVLTVGVDSSWRIVDTKHLSREDSRLLNTCPLVTGGFVHWVQDLSTDLDRDLVRRRTFESMENGRNINSITTTREVMMKNTSTGTSICFLTMNMETEVITQCLAPPWNDVYCYYKYFSGGKYLSLMIGRGDLKWEVWEMEPETSKREWRKVWDVDLEGHEGLLNQLQDRFKPPAENINGALLDWIIKPAGWLEYGSVIIFVVYVMRKGRGYFCQAGLRGAYNVQTRDVCLFEFENFNNHPYLVHTNSLVWIR